MISLLYININVLVDLREIRMFMDLFYLNWLI